MKKICLKISIILIFFIGNLRAQTVNIGDLSILNNTDFSTFFNFENTAAGDVINDGRFYVYSNFKNDGLVTFTNTENGTTIFRGTQIQLIEGSQNAHFQNIVFDNTSAITPFHLNTIINVGKNVSFKNGIVDAESFNGKMVFEENAFHSDASNLSFVDGKVENLGNLKFEFPVGDDVYFRPSIHEKAADPQNIYTTQYQFKNAGPSRPYTSKDEGIISIDEVEYWNVEQDQGSEKIVLSLTLDANTTPALFFQENAETGLAIVRWDNTTSKWINEKGVTTDLLTGADYTKMITTQVSGYGIFTIAIVEKANPEPPGDLEIFNALSPNGDGVNDSFHIKGIDNYPDNRVEIYNCWGVKVYDVESYNESNVMFKGYSDGRSTVKRSEGLPTGTYFYILKYVKDSKTIEKTGYLYIGNDN